MSTEVAPLPRDYHIRLPVSLAETMRRHAFDRNVSLTRLLTDVLTLWAITMTDPQDPVFAQARMGVPLPAFLSEPRAGYLASLCQPEDP